MTDYDCWREATEAVSVEADPRRAGAERGRRAAERCAEAVPGSTDPGRCACRDALRFAILTDPKAIPDGDEGAAPADRREVPLTTIGSVNRETETKHAGRFSVFRFPFPVSRLRRSS